MVHQRFDLDRWIRQFPLAKQREEGRAWVEHRRATEPEQYKDEAAVEAHMRLMQPGGEIVTSPIDMATVEQLRAEAWTGKQLRTAKTDVFVFAMGEPADRSITKVGGLPFLPKDTKWPTYGSDEPMSFVVQVCFADSMDIVGDLPGDVLLIFSKGQYLKHWMGNDPGDLHFEWVKREETIPIEVCDIPKQKWEILPCHGELHRTVDFIESDPSLGERYKSAYCIGVIEATKIGGVPRWIQGKEELPGRFLCAVGSTWPSYVTGTGARPFPFTNVPEPMTLRDFKSLPLRFLMWGDVGSLFIFLDGRKLHWTIQDY